MRNWRRSVSEPLTQQGQLAVLCERDRETDRQTDRQSHNQLAAEGFAKGIIMLHYSTKLENFHFPLSKEFNQL